MHTKSLLKRDIHFCSLDHLFHRRPTSVFAVHILLDLLFLIGRLLQCSKNCFLLLENKHFHLMINNATSMVSLSLFLFLFFCFFKKKNNNKKMNLCIVKCCYTLLRMIRFEEAGLIRTHEGLQHHATRPGC